MSQPLRVLILEDKPDDAELMLHELRRAGYAPRAERAVDQPSYLTALDNDLDIILSDYSLPQFNAMAALELLLDSGRDLPFVVVTGTISEEAAVECLRRGAADYVLKDRLMRLGPAVRRALDEARLRHQARLAEQALRDSEANYRLLAENSTDLIARFSAEGLCLYASPASRHLLGFEPEELLGRSVYDLLHSDDAAMFYPVYDGQLPDALRLAFRARRKDGGYLWLETTMRLVRHPETGLIQEVVAVARDITARKETEGALRARERFLTLLNDITLAALETPALGVMLETFADRLRDLLEADACLIALWEAGAQFPGQTVIAGRERQTYQDHARPLAGEPNLFSACLRLGQPLAVDDIANSPHTSARQLEHLPLRAALALPLVSAGRQLGAAVIAFHAPHSFPPEEVIQGEQAARQVALALANARQRADLERRAQENEALARISRELSETLDLDRMLQMIVEAARQVIPSVVRAVIHLMADDRETLRAAAVAGMEELGRPDFSLRLGVGVAGLVMAEGRTLNVHDTQTDPRYLPLGQAQHLRSLLVAPVQTPTRRLGTISALGSSPDAFSAEDEHLLTTLGLQAALAIENARLYQAARRRLQEVNALYQVSQGLTGSLDLDEVLQRVVTLLQTNFGYYHVHVYTVEPGAGDLVMRQGTGLIGQQLKAAGHRLPPGTGIVGHAVDTGQPFMTNNVDEVVFFTRNPLLPDTRSELAVPLRAGNEVLGVLDIQQRPPQDFGPQDLQLMTTVADQLAVALQKAVLHADLQTALRHEQAARNQLVQAEKLAAMGRLVASVAHELNNPLQAIQNALFLVREEESLDAQAHQDLEVALSETDRMASLISRLRETYRPTSVEQFQPESINQLVGEVEKLIGTHLRHHNITLTFEADPDLPEALMIRDQIKQVILNLCLNAVEAMPSGGQLRLATCADPAEGLVWLACSDTGLGIQPADLPHIFDPFYTTKDSGTGLGLAITYDIVQKHNGRLLVESQVGQGTTFKFSLPLTQA